MPSSKSHGNIPERTLKMASTNSLTLHPEAGTVALIGGGKLTEVKDFKDQKEVGPKLRDGRQLRRAPGITAMLDGVPLDGFTVQTVADIDAFPDGCVLAASGVVEITIRGEARPGFGDSGPRANLTGSVFVEGITPVGTFADLLTNAARRQGKEA